MISDAISSYLAVIRDTRSPKTHTTYAQALKSFVEIVGDDTPLTTDTYIKYLRSTKDMNPGTQMLFRVAIQGLFIFYGSTHPEVNLIALRQATKQYGLRRGQRLPNFDKEAIETIITHCEAHREDIIALRDRAFIITLADTGLRISEACSLRRGDIDWREARAYIIGKGDKQALIRFSERSMAAMHDYLNARSEMDGGTGKPLSSLPVFARHDLGAGKKLKPVQSGGMWAAVKLVAEKAGVDPSTIRVHDFRHYFVTTVYTLTRDIKATQVLARHSDISTTGRYAHLDDELDEVYNTVFNQKSRK
jgi:integrase/recombinase XerC